MQEQQEQISQLELSVRSAERARRLDAALVHQMPSLEQWHSIQVGVDRQAGCSISSLGSQTPDGCPKQRK